MARVSNKEKSTNKAEISSFPSAQPHAPATSAAAPWRAPALALLILALTFLAYLPALRGAFLWDDDKHFSENPHMTRPGGLAGVWTERIMYYPLTSTTFWVARRAWGLNPVPYHLLNVALHGANALLLWLLLRRLRVRGAWLAGALFALHPVNVQSVAWMTELKNVQSGLFYLLALHAWVASRERGGKLPYAAALFSFALALLSKTSTVTLPLALIVIQLWRREPLNRRSALALGPFFALSGLAGLMTVTLHNPMVDGPEWGETFPERVILAARGVWFYLSKLFVPLNLSFVYPRWEIDARRLADWLWVPGLILLLGAPLLCRSRAWSRPTALALACYVASLLPVLNFFRMYYTRYSYAADHWQYLAAMGGVAWIAGGADWLAAHSRLRPRQALLLVIALLAALGGLTWRQAHIYRNPVTLWNDVIKKNPHGAIAYHNLGCHFLAQGQNAIAERVLAAGLQFNPDDPELLTVHGAALVALNRPQESLSALERAFARTPGDPDLLNNLGSALSQLGRTDEAALRFREALKRKPDLVQAWYNLGQTLLAAGRRDEARAAAREGLRANPGDPNLNALLERIGE